MICGMCQNLAFVSGRDDNMEAQAFARQAVRQYRKGVLEVHGRIMRRGMIEAYLCAKRYASP